MLLLAFMLAAQTIEAEQSQYPPDPPCPASSTLEMSLCLKRNWQVWDKRLNTEYTSALERVTPKARPWLRHSQRLWLKYRDANCRMYSNHEGTVAQLWSVGCPLDMTKKRALELHDMD